MRKHSVLDQAVRAADRLALVLTVRAERGLGYESEEVTVSANGYTLAGTLLLPRGVRRPMPAAILITGSGPQNRDSQLAGLENYRPFKQIAEHLAGLRSRRQL